MLSREICLLGQVTSFSLHAVSGGSVKRRSALLLHPIFLLSLGTLLLNDHYLKQAYPGWLTGKLSDFSGLLVLSWVVVWSLERWFDSRKSIALIHLTCGIAFALWKLLPMENWLSDVLSLISLPGVIKTPDATDLIALLILPVSYRFLVAVQPVSLPKVEKVPRLALYSVLLVTLFAIVATSPPRARYTLHSEEAIPMRMGIERTLWTIEEALYTAGIDVVERHRSDNGVFELTYEVSSRVGPELADARRMQGYIRYTIDSHTQVCNVKTIHIWGYLHGVPYEIEPFLDAICRDYILKSIVLALEKE